MGNSSTQNAGSHSKSQSSEEEASRKTYEVTELPALKEKKTFGWFTGKDFILTYQEYYPINFTTQNRSKIYAIAWREDGKEIERKYFTNEQDRKEHIKTLPDYLNYRECDDCIFDSETGVIKKENLEQRCQTGEFFPYILNTQNMTLYAIIFRTNEKTGLHFDYWKDEATRTQALDAHYAQYENLLDREAKPVELNQPEIQEFVQSNTHVALTQFCHDQVPPNVHLGNSIKRKDKNTLFYPLACGGEQTPRYFTTEEARNKAVEEYKEQCVALDAQTRETILSKNLNTLITKDKMYFKTEYELKGKKSFVIIYPFTINNEKIFTYKTFPSLEDRQTFLSKNILFVELGTASTTSQSKNGQAQIKMSEQHDKFLQDQAKELANDGKKEYATFNVPSISDPSKTIYALTFSEKLPGYLKNQPKVEHFDSLEERQTFIKNRLNGYCYSEKIKLDQVFNGAPEGMLGDQGLKKALHINQILRKSGDTFTFEFQANDKTLYAWATQGKGKLDVHYAENETARTAKFLNRKPPINDLTTLFINSLDHQALEETKERLFKEKNIERECPLALNAWLEESVEVNGQKVDIFFHRGQIADSQHPICVSYSKGGTIWPDIQPHLGTKGGYKLKSPVPQDRKTSSIPQDSKISSTPQDSKSSSVPQNLKADDEFDVETGEAMLACSWSKKSLELREQSLFVKEYISLEVTKEALQQKGYHEAIFPLLSSNENGKVTYRYFKTDEALKMHLKNSLTGYVNGWARQLSNEHHVQLRAVEYLKKLNTTDPNAQTLVYTVFVSPNKEKAHIVAVKYDNTIPNAKNDLQKCVVVTSTYGSGPNLTERIAEFLLTKGEQIVNSATFSQKPSLTEKKYAIHNTKGQVQPLREKELTQKSYLGYYMVVFVRHADKNGQPKTEEKVYLASDPKLHKYTNSLQKNGYNKK